MENNEFIKESCKEILKKKWILKHLIPKRKEEEQETDSNYRTGKCLRDQKVFQ